MIKKKVYSFLVAFSLGAVIGVAIKYIRHFTFDFEISLFDFFQLVVTVFLAWWVAKKLEKDSTVERCEKDIIIDRMKVLDGIISELRTVVLSSDIVPLTTVNRLIGSFDEISNRVIDTLNSNYGVILSNADNDYSDNLDLLDHLCSDDKHDPASIAVEDRDGESICIYTAERLNSVLDSASTIQDKLFKLQLLLNRA